MAGQEPLVISRKITLLYEKMMQSNVTEHTHLANNRKWHAHITPISNIFWGRINAMRTLKYTIGTK